MKSQLFSIVACALLSLGILSCSSEPEEVNCSEAREMVAENGLFYAYGFYTGTWIKKEYTSDQIDVLKASLDACLSEGDQS